MRLVLGTAQLGMQYGVANRTGMPDRATVEEIVNAAWSGGIKEFDTAQAYGESERALGRAFTTLGLGYEVSVVSKLAPGVQVGDRDHIFRSVRQSLKNLGVESLSGLLLHSEQDFASWDQGLGEIMLDLVKQGLTKRVGVSVYSPEKALAALNTEGIEAIQVPSNMLDRRFEAAGVFDLADKRGVKIYVRSVFLQGLLLLQPADLPSNLAMAAPTLKDMQALGESLGLTRKTLAMAYAVMAYPKAGIVVGSETAGQVKENISLYKAEAQNELVEMVRNRFIDIPEKLLNPALWGS
jgi:aryl-alcohol dehydrogenase-like predicted oxidoreductase